MLKIAIVALALFIPVCGLLLTASNDLKAPKGSTLHQLWTFRAIEGVDPPRPGIVFCILDNQVERELIVGRESLATVDGLRGVLNSEREAVELYRCSAPPRDIDFHRFDMDNDGVDEVLLTGTGGAGGTTYLMVFRVRNDRVDKLFGDTSRFGFRIVDRKGGGKYEIANPGFDWVRGAEDVMEEKHFRLYQLSDTSYIEHQIMNPREMDALLSKLSVRSGSPVAKDRSVGVLRFYD